MMANIKCSVFIFLAVFGVQLYSCHTIDTPIEIAEHLEGLRAISTNDALENTTAKATSEARNVEYELFLTHFRNRSSMKIEGILQLRFVTSSSTWERIISAETLNSHRTTGSLLMVTLPVELHELHTVRASYIGHQNSYMIKFDELVMMPSKTKHTLGDGLSPAFCAKFGTLLSRKIFIGHFEYCTI
ncbi:hypothetical protein HDE_04348 [Halotydeus destructor]|nr:hypothetical protein HDE_04348 [Halotydeus destructor]